MAQSQGYEALLESNKELYLEDVMVFEEGVVEAATDDSFDIKKGCRNKTIIGKPLVYSNMVASYDSFFCVILQQ